MTQVRGRPATALFLIGSAWSHVNPTLPLLCELRDRGAAVVYCADERFRGAVERLGAAFSPVSPDAPEAGPALPDGPSSLRRAVARRRGLAAALRRVSRVADAVRTATSAPAVLDPTTGWHGLAASLGVPVATVTPSFLYREDSPLIVAGLPTAADRRSPALRAADRQLGRVQARLARRGIPPTDADRLFTAPAELKLAATYREFQPDADLFPPPRFVYLGAALTCRPEPALPGLDSLHGPLAYVSMGSAAEMGADLAHAVLGAFADGAWSVVLAGLRDGAVRLSSWAIGSSYVPQLRVLERAAVFVTHGGMNSVVEAIAHAVPTVLLPETAEQGLVARRAEQLGLGVVLSRADLEPERLRRVCEELRRDRRVARALAEARSLARDRSGVALAAETLLALATRGPVEPFRTT